MSEGTYQTDSYTNSRNVNGDIAILNCRSLHASASQCPVGLRAVNIYIPAHFPVCPHGQPRDLSLHILTGASSSPMAWRLAFRNPRTRSAGFAWRFTDGHLWLPSHLGILAAAARGQQHIVGV